MLGAATLISTVMVAGSALAQRGFAPGQPPPLSVVAAHGSVR